MPCTPSAPSTQSSMPLLLLGPLPYRILNILNILITGGPSLCLPLYGREFLPLRVVVHGTVSGRMADTLPLPTPGFKYASIIVQTGGFVPSRFVFDICRPYSNRAFYYLAFERLLHSDI